LAFGVKWTLGSSVLGSESGSISVNAP